MSVILLYASTRQPKCIRYEPRDHSIRLDARYTGKHLHVVPCDSGLLTWDPEPHSFDTFRRSGSSAACRRSCAVWMSSAIGTFAAS